MHDHVHPSPTTARGREASIERAFAVSIALNTIYVIAEFGYGLAAESVALMADAAHNLGDVLGLLIAWGATWLARRAPSGQRTYGWQKSTVLAALANALLLIGVTGGLVWEAIVRLADPPEPVASTMMIVAGVGVVINALSAVYLLRSGHAHGHGHGHDGHDHDANLRGAFLHMAADAGVSVGVVITGALLAWFGWAWLDPAVSILIAVVIFASTWSLLREALDLALDAAPSHIDVNEVRACLADQAGVDEVHDLHIWALGTRDVALTAHLVVGDRSTQLLRAIEDDLDERFGIRHSTIQIEDGACDQRC